MKCIGAFCFLCLVPALGLAKTPIEVIIGGVSYASIEEYRKAGKSKDIDANPKEEKAIKQLETASYEHSMNTVMTDFRQNWDDPIPKFTLKRDELAERMRALVGDRAEPVLVIAEPHKLRVMALKDAPNK